MNRLGAQLCQAFDEHIQRLPRVERADKSQRRALGNAPRTGLLRIEQFRVHAIGHHDHFFGRNACLVDQDVFEGIGNAHQHIALLVGAHFHLLRQAVEVQRATVEARLAEQRRVGFEYPGNALDLEGTSQRLEQTQALVCPIHLPNFGGCLAGMVARQSKPQQIGGGAAEQATAHLAAQVGAAPALRQAVADNIGNHSPALALESAHHAEDVAARSAGIGIDTGGYARRAGKIGNGSGRLSHRFSFRSRMVWLSRIICRTRLVQLWQVNTSWRARAPIACHCDWQRYALRRVSLRLSLSSL